MLILQAEKVLIMISFLLGFNLEIYDKMILVMISLLHELNLK